MNQPPRQRRLIRRIAAACSSMLVVASCSGGSDADDDDAGPVSVELAQQDVSEADPPAEALVTETSSTTTTTTTDAPRNTENDPSTDPANSGGGAAEPTGNEVAFEADQVLTVGDDIEPGFYISQAADNFCSWTRTLSDDTTDDGFNQGQIVLEIPFDDVSFESSVDCGMWDPYVVPDEPAVTIGEGYWAVGQQIAPGTYETDDAEFEFCYWERSAGFTESLDEIIENGIPEERVTVEILPTDARFVSSGCGTWTLVT